MDGLLSIPQIISVFGMISLKRRTAFITRCGGFGSPGAAGMAEADINILVVGG